MGTNLCCSKNASLDTSSLRTTGKNPKEIIQGEMHLELHGKKSIDDPNLIEDQFEFKKQNNFISNQEPCKVYTGA